jgi:long-chain fatty acid transport protein
MESKSNGFRSGYMLLVAQLACSGTGFAGGLAVYEQSASGAARGLAGAAAIADDASTVFYNPAGMTRLPKNEIVVALGSNFPRATFENASGFDPAGGPLGGTPSLPHRTLYVPSAFAVWAVSQDLRIGAGVNAPFGQDVKYNEGWIGRYFVTNAELKTVNLSATLAWRVAPALSVGGGLDYQTADVSRRSAIDFGSACFGVLGPAACAGLGLLPQAQDGSVNLDASSSGVGYNLGILLEPREGLRLGAAYRSRIAHDFSGTAAFSVPAAATLLTAGGTFRSTGVSTRITLPEIVSLGVAADLSPEFTLLAGLIWSRSSRLDNLVIRFDNPAQPTVIEPQNWKNTYRASMGFDYRLSAALIAHGGAAFDQSPIPAQFRYPYLPDSDRLSLNTGLTWKPGGTVSFTVSYTYSHARDAPIAQISPAAGALTGTFKRDFNVLGLQAGFRF